MPDILSPLETVTKQVKTRAPRIHIENPSGPEKSISFASESVVMIDGVPVATLDAPPVKRAFPAVAAETFTITDPVTGQAVTISVAGIATAIEEAYVRWYNQDRQQG